jgi:uncharacterized protein YecE (DUF72 family)
MNLNAGTSGYSYTPWKGKFYPKREAFDVETQFGEST